MKCIAHVKMYELSDAVGIHVWNRYNFQ